MGALDKAFLKAYKDQKEAAEESLKRVRQQLAAPVVLQFPSSREYAKTEMAAALAASEKATPKTQRTHHTAPAIATPATKRAGSVVHTSSKTTTSPHHADKSTRSTQAASRHAPVTPPKSKSTKNVLKSTPASATSAKTKKSTAAKAKSPSRQAKISRETRESKGVFYRVDKPSHGHSSTSKKQAPAAKIPAPHHKKHKKTSGTHTTGLPLKAHKKRPTKKSRPENASTAKHPETPRPERIDESFAPPASSAPTAFQPALQVNHFNLSKTCRDLELLCPSAIEALTETIQTEVLRGRKVIALFGAHSGAGTTSLAICAARQLALRAWKTVLVEGDWEQPQLGRRMGLLPQQGWEEVLEGQLPVDEVLVESMEERLVVFPCRGPVSIGDPSREISQRLTTVNDLLRKHYDVVLIDAGRVGQRSLLNMTSDGFRMDAALCVQNAQQESRGGASAMPLPLDWTTCDVPILGAVENFTLPAGQYA